MPSLEACIALKHALAEEQLVCMPLDRDPHRTVLCTRAAYVHRLKTLFVDDTTHYEVCTATPATIEARWREMFDAAGWRRYGHFDARGSVGYAYCFAKAKNLAKSRVIVSCAKHPLRSILHLVGRVLIQLLLRSAFPSFNLYSLQEFTARLEEYSQTVDPSDSLFGLYTDVEEMYTGMKHGAILDAVAFVLELCKAALRSPYVSVAKQHRGAFHVGQSRAKGVATFHLDDLLPFVRFELENLCFTLGPEVLLRQVIGAPMGGFTSPGCAQCVAAVAEYRCMRLVLASSRLFAARYMDDTFCVLNITATQRCSATLSEMLHPLLHMFADSGLEVEVEPALWAPCCHPASLWAAVSSAPFGTRTPTLRPPAPSVCAAFCRASPRRALLSARS